MGSGSSILRPLMVDTYNLKPSEKSALKNLKEKLNSSYKNNNVYMWGIPLTMTSSDECDVIFLKFLRATNFIVEDSFEKLVNCLSWRKEFGADSIVEERLGFQDLYDYMYCFFNFDRQGNPVCYIDYSNLINKQYMHYNILGIEENRLKFIRWRVQVLERAIKMLDFKPGGINSITMVHDFDYEWTREIGKVEDHIYSIIQHNYPGIISCKIDVNVPWYVRIFQSIRRLFFTQIDSAIGELVIANQGNVFETLYKYIRPERIPSMFGGLTRYQPENAPMPFFETTVEGGAKLSISVDGIEANSKIKLSLVVGGWDLEYSAKFVPDAVTRFAYMVVEPMKIKATDLAHNITHFANEAGKYVLSIDNTASRKRKVVAYQYLVYEDGWY